MMGKLRHIVPTWPPIAGMSEEDGMRAIQEMALETCFIGLDLSCCSLAQIKIARETAVQGIQTQLRAWKISLESKTSAAAASDDFS